MFQKGLWSVLVCVCIERVIWACPCFSVCFRKKKTSLLTLKLVPMRVCAHVSLQSCGSMQCKYLSASTPLDLFLTTKHPMGALVILGHNPRWNTLPCADAWWLVCEKAVSDSPRSRRPRCIFAEGVLSRPLQSFSSNPWLQSFDKCPRVWRKFSWSPRSWRFFAAVSSSGKWVKLGMSDHLMALSLTCAAWPNYKMSSQQQFASKKHPSPGASCIIMNETFDRCGYKYEAKATLPQYCRLHWSKKLEEPYLRGVRLWEAFRGSSETENVPAVVSAGMPCWLVFMQPWTRWAGLDKTHLLSGGHTHLSCKQCRL